MLFGKRKEKKARENHLREIENNVASSILSAVCKMLPTEFDFLSRQFNDGAVKGAQLRDPSNPEDHTRQFMFNFDMPIVDYVDEEGKWYTIENIYVSDFSLNSYHISINILMGIFDNYTIELSSLENINTSSVDVSDIKIRYRTAELYKLFTDDELVYLGSSALSEIKFDGETYYILFYLDGGDCIVTNANKQVYKIIGSPYNTIVPIESDLLAFLEHYHSKES